MEVNMKIDMDALNDLVQETIIPALYEDLEITNKKDFKKAIDFIIESLNDELKTM